jgi:hypothetical protein
MLGGLVLEFLDVLWERRDGDGRGLVAFSAWQALPELFGQEGHEGVDHGQAALDGGVEGLLGALFLLFGTVVEDGLAVLNVGIAQKL